MKGNITCVGYYEPLYTNIDNKFYYIINIYDLNKNHIDTNVYDSRAYMNSRMDILDKEGFVFVRGIKEE